MRSVKNESIVIGTLLMYGIACSGSAITDTLPSFISSESVYWSLTANYRAVNLAMVAPYNTVQLEAIPRNSDGMPIPNEGRMPTYTVFDTTKLDVSENGVVTAKTTGTNIVILLSLQIGTITHVDTVFVKVAAVPPVAPLATFSIQPVYPDSAIWSAGGSGNLKKIRPTAKDAMNGNIANLQVRYTSSSPQIATVAPDGITNAKMKGIRMGRVWITASTYAYGVHMIDSAEFLIGYPASQTINVDRIPGVNGDDVAFYPSTITLGVGGTVSWDFRGQWRNVQSPGILFDEPEKAKGTYPATACEELYAAVLLDACDGNSAPRPIYGADLDDGSFSPVMTTRKWDEPGVYTYRDHWGKRSGTVIVLARPNL